MKYENAAISAALDKRFPKLVSDEIKIPMWYLTPSLGPCLHRFFDTSPISPSGRFLALSRLTVTDRQQKPGEDCSILVIDLFTGKLRFALTTSVWDTQVGCHIQWGKDDDTIFFNNMEPGRFEPFGVKVDLVKKKGHRMGGPIYMVSPDGKMSASPCLARMRQAQPGYSVALPKENVPDYIGATLEDGVHLTDMESGDTVIQPSFAEIFEATGLSRTIGGSEDRVYGFHAKWNADSSRLMFILRHKKPGKPQRSHIITMKADGSEIKLALPWRKWAAGGHHPNWHPDGEHITMNLMDKDKLMRFVQFRYDGTGFKVLSDGVLGSGHPTISASGRYMITDAKPKERIGGPRLISSPLRLIDLKEGTDTHLAQLPAKNPNSQKRLYRIDLHPAWDQEHQMVTMNCILNGQRAVVIGSLAGLRLQ